MSELPVWFERKFKFEFPVELYPNLRVRLRGAPTRLEELIGGLSKEQLEHKPDGKWSIQENAGHLLDLEPLWASRVEDFLSGAELLTAADLANTKTQQANHNDLSINEIMKSFREARCKSLKQLDALSPDCFARTALHPRLQTPMRFVDHLYFVAEHDDHHLARIWELAQGKGS